jgi:hypothetical protein
MRRLFAVFVIIRADVALDMRPAVGAIAGMDDPFALEAVFLKAEVSPHITARAPQ